MVTANEVMTNFGTSGFGLDHTVFLQFSEGNDTGNGAQSNRIMLKAESISIDTSRNVPQIPIPFSDSKLEVIKYTMSGFVGWMTMELMEVAVSVGKPLVTSVNVSPPSLERKI